MMKNPLKCLLLKKININNLFKTQQMKNKVTDLTVTSKIKSKPSLVLLQELSNMRIWVIWCLYKVEEITLSI